MLKPEDLVRISEIADAEVAAYIRELPGNIRGMLNAAMYSVLGLRNEYGGKLEVDRCNGRQTVITKLLDEKCKKAVAEHVEPVLMATLKLLAADKKALLTIAKEAKSCYERTLVDAVRSMAIEKAKAQAVKIVEGLEKVDLNRILLTNIDIEDPESFDTHIGQVLLADIAEYLAAGKPVPEMVKDEKGRLMVACPM